VYTKTGQVSGNALQTRQKPVFCPSVAYLTRLLPGAALAVTVALAAAGCGSAPADTASTTSTNAAPSVTPAVARQVFGSYVAASARATAQRNQAAALALTEGVQWIQVKAAYLAEARGGKLPRYRYGTPVFYLPSPGGYPQWFVANAPRSTKNAGPLPGLAMPARGHVLMLFEKSSPASPWLLARTAQLAPGESVPKLATANGYVPVQATSDTALLARPDVAGALQAAVVDDGPASAAARVVAAGPLTTGMYQAASTSAPVLAAPRGDVYQWALDGSGFTKFALRTADGGALVFYVMYLDTTVEVPALANDAQPVPPGRPITIPAYLRPLLPARQAAPRMRLESQELFSFAAVDPPSPPAKIQVIADGGGLSYASAS
jgi:hypothetical protein